MLYLRIKHQFLTKIIIMKNFISSIILFSSVCANAQVGINTESPSRTLDVNGTLRVRTQTDQSTNSAYNNVLVSDANGNVDHVKKNTLNQQMVQLFSLSILLSVSVGGFGTPVRISNQSITLSKPAFVIINFSVPIALSSAASDGKMKNCLFGAEEFDLLKSFRELKDLTEIIKLGILKKHKEKGGQFDRLEKVDNRNLINRSMIKIGG